MAQATRFGALVQALGWACFPLALLTQRLGLAVLGTALVATVALASPPRSDITVRRDLPEGARADEECVVVTRAGSASPAPLFVTDPVPQSLRVLELGSTPGRGLATQRVVLRLDAGAHRWGPVHVRVQDDMGLCEEDVVVPHVQYLEVVPSNRPVLLGERSGMLTSFGKKTTLFASGDPEREHEGIREYMPGDRFRDIDWAHSSALGELLVRETRPHAHMPIVVALQAGVAMRWTRRSSKLASLSHVGLAVLAAAHRSHRPAGFMAWTEWGVSVAMRPTTAGRVVAGAMRQLAALPHSPAPRTLGGGVPIDLSGITAQERDFLDAASSFNPAPSGPNTPLESALASLAVLAPQPCHVVLLVDGEEAPMLVEILVGRLLRRRHHVVVVCPAIAPHYFSRSDVDDAAIEHILRWRRNREQVRAFCEARRVRFVSLRPSVSDVDVQAVIRSIR